MAGKHEEVQGNQVFSQNESLPEVMRVTCIYFWTQNKEISQDRLKRRRQKLAPAARSSRPSHRCWSYDDHSFD